MLIFRAWSRRAARSSSRSSRLVRRSPAGRAAAPSVLLPHPLGHLRGEPGHLLLGHVGTELRHLHVEAERLERFRDLGPRRLDVLLHRPVEPDPVQPLEERRDVLWRRGHTREDLVDLLAEDDAQHTGVGLRHPPVVQKAPERPNDLGAKRGDPLLAWPDLLGMEDQRVVEAVLLARVLLAQ